MMDETVVGEAVESLVVLLGVVVVVVLWAVVVAAVTLGVVALEREKQQYRPVNELQFHEVEASSPPHREASSPSFTQKPL